jgi:hypothetical protein
MYRPIRLDVCCDTFRTLTKGVRNFPHQILFAILTTSKYFTIGLIISIDYPEQYIMIKR